MTIPEVYWQTIGMGYAWRRMHEWILYCPNSDHVLADNARGDIIRCPVGDKEHPTQKPVNVVVPLILNSSPADGLVLDPFCGSGTVGVACVRTGRRFIGVESGEKYAAMARDRIVAELAQGDWIRDTWCAARQEALL
jgi:DNA modification methylase